VCSGGGSDTENSKVVTTKKEQKATINWLLLLMAQWHQHWPQVNSRNQNTNILNSVMIEPCAAYFII